MSNTLSEADVEKLVGQLEIQYCAEVQMLCRSGTTLLSYVETGLRDAGALPGIPMSPDHDDSKLATHYPAIAARLEKMQVQLGECGC